MKFLRVIMAVFVFSTSHCYAQLFFNDDAASLGISVTGSASSILGGVSFFDYDNDGWDDLTFASKGNFGVKFFKNNSGTFVEDTFNISITGHSKQVLWVDYDNDGDNDLFVTKVDGVNKLYQNDGNFIFTDVTFAAGLPNFGVKYTYGAAFGDYDNDGHLDLFLCNKDDMYVIPNELYHNNGDGTFTNVTATSGISTVGHLSFCASFFDYDNDGYQDIYISNDRIANPNILYRNNGNGTFTDVSAASGTDVIANAMSTTIDDYNNDGWLDIYVTNTVEGNFLLCNNWDGTFTDIALASGTIFNSIGWGASFFDADNDTDLDLYVSSMIDNPNLGIFTYAFYEQVTNNTFTVPLNAGFSDDQYISFANAIGDVNNDGLTDLVIVNQAPDNHSLRVNATNNSNNFLKVKLEGTSSNKNGIGSWIEISINGEKQYRYVLCGEGFLGQNSNIEIFGLGTTANIDYVAVYWLSGTIDVLTDVTPNQTLNIVEGSTLSEANHDFNSLKLFPNPTQNYVEIVGLKTVAEANVIDYLGRLVYKQVISSTNNKIDLSQLSKGVYNVEIKVNNSVVSKKVVVY
ncbi:FG-GAP-like repeat-containing protein [Pontimicrobium sp. IMCC45349]|uniref:FG-GAP-like repeat-containing protein n=1 Tax=Pontimicrobium sp. IMCC45349 TaxID=3391574 RepID=UPI0039A0768F